MQPHDQIHFRLADNGCHRSGGHRGGGVADRTVKAIVEGVELSDEQIWEMFEKIWRKMEAKEYHAWIYGRPCACHPKGFDAEVPE